jgi:hypothetical protein
MFTNCIRSITLISIVMMTLSCIAVSAQFVPFEDPIINIETVTGKEDLNETYLRVTIADPENPFNGVYINTDANNGLLDFRIGETVIVSGLDPAYFVGNFLTASLIKDSVIKISPDSKFLNVEFLGIREPLYNTNDLEEDRINFTIPSGIERGNYTFVIVTGEEELHYYTTYVRIR